jgi:hypothetical protein
LNEEPALNHVNKRAARVLDVLTANLKVGEFRRFDLSNGTFMPVTVERLTTFRFSVTHYYKQNGDLVPDPDMEFLKGTAGDQSVWTPVSIQHATGHFACALELDGDVPVRYRPRILRELVNFSHTWMRNIIDQQGGLVAMAAESARPPAGRHPA